MKLVCFLMVNFFAFSLHLSAGWWDKLFFCCLNQVSDEAVCSLISHQEGEDIQDNSELTWQEIKNTLGPDVMNCALIPLRVMTHPSPQLLDDIGNLNAQ